MNTRRTNSTIRIIKSSCGIPLIILLSCILVLLCSKAAVSEENSGKNDKIHTIVHTGKGLSLHKEMYVLPFSFSKDQNSQVEMVFQISAKQRIFNTNFYFGYTQKSFWEAYNFSESSPFRETNYNPEFFYRFKPGTLRYKHLGADIGFEHESNGQSLPASRSWNRIYAAPYYANGNFLLYTKFWYRIPEDEKDPPQSTKGDDNPDITDYLGYCEINVFHQYWKKHLAHTMLRGNINTGKGAISLNYSVPVPTGNMFFVLRIFHGYGESLIDYNRSVTSVGLGFMLKR